MATSFSGGRSRSIRRETPTMGKQLVNFIPCGCESSAPFFVIYKAGHDVKFEVSVDQAMRQMKLSCCFFYLTFFVIYYFLTQNVIVNKGATSETVTACPSEAPEFIPFFCRVRVAQCLVFRVLSCGSLLVLLSFISCRLSFFDLLLLITYLISSNFAYS
jgi:hypothetical protein